MSTRIVHCPSQYHTKYVLIYSPPRQVNFNEPISFLQRLTEDMEYADLLTRAASATSVEESLCYLSALAVSSYATTSTRTSEWGCHVIYDVVINSDHGVCAVYLRPEP